MKDSEYLIVHAVCIYTVKVRPVESHSGARGTFSLGLQTFSQSSSGKKMFKFFFLKWYILAYFIFLADGGAPKRCPG